MVQLVDSNQSPSFNLRVNIGVKKLVNKALCLIRYSFLQCNTFRSGPDCKLQTVPGWTPKVKQHWLRVVLESLDWSANGPRLRQLLRLVILCYCQALDFVHKSSGYENGGNHLLNGGSKLWWHVSGSPLISKSTALIWH